MENKSLAEIYESVRSIILITESIADQITRLKHLQLREQLTDLIRTVQGDLLILADLLIELMNCETESDLDFLLEHNSDVSD